MPSLPFGVESIDIHEVIADCLGQLCLLSIFTSFVLFLKVRKRYFKKKIYFPLQNNPMLKYGPMKGMGFCLGNLFPLTNCGLIFLQALVEEILSSS